MQCAYHIIYINAVVASARAWSFISIEFFKPSHRERHIAAHKEYIPGCRASGPAQVSKRNPNATMYHPTWHKHTYIHTHGTRVQTAFNSRFWYLHPSAYPTESIARKATPKSDIDIAWIARALARTKRCLTILWPIAQRTIRHAPYARAALSANRESYII